MDFDFTPEQQTFRREVRAWLAEHVPADLKDKGFASSRADVNEVKVKPPPVSYSMRRSPCHA